MNKTFFKNHKAAIAIALVLTFALSFTVVLAAVSPSFAAVAANTNTVAGDVNSDGVVDNDDAYLLAKHLAKWDGIEIDERAADVNFDGAIGVKDAVLLTQRLADYAKDTETSIIGDVNHDGLINDNDTTLLAQYLAEWDVTIDEFASDCYKDGTITSKDLVLLAQYVSGWDVELPMIPQVSGTNEGQTDEIASETDAESATSYTFVNVTKKNRYDLNKDGVANEDDFNMVLCHLLHSIGRTQYAALVDPSIADFDNDGKVTTKDGQIIYDYLVAHGVVIHEEWEIATNPASTNTAKKSRYDLNEDGSVNEDDFNMVLCHLLNSTGRTQYAALVDPSIADFDKDGKVTTKDGQIIYDYLKEIGINIHDN